MKYFKLTGIVILIIDFLIIYYRRDIVIELCNGRDLNQLNIYKLLLPIILIIISIYLIFKKNQNDENKTDN